jgi:excisionase family DNA binding protein
MLSSRMQAKQTTQHRSLTNNTEAPAARQPGRPLTKRELAMFLGITERFIELEVNRGRLRAVRLSNRLLRFRPIDVERWMESSLTTGGESRRDGTLAYEFRNWLASFIDNRSVAALERPLPLLSVQRLSTTFNTVQHPSTAFNVSNTSSVETR